MLKYRIPAMLGNRLDVQNGLMSYVGDLSEHWMHVADYVDRIRRALLDIFEVAVLERRPQEIDRSEANFVAASSRVHEGRALLSLPTNRMTYVANSSSNPFASFRSRVSSPSVNHP
jgi:hypothetical protein